MGDLIFGLCGEAASSPGSQCQVIKLRENYPLPTSSLLSFSSCLSFSLSSFTLCLSLSLSLSHIAYEFPFINQHLKLNSIYSVLNIQWINTNLPSHTHRHTKERAHTHTHRSLYRNTTSANDSMCESLDIDTGLYYTRFVFVWESL